jgi:hypothetical protein
MDENAKSWKNAIAVRLKNQKKNINILLNKKINIFASDFGVTILLLRKSDEKGIR